MTPAHTVKKGVRYRYYVSQALLQRRNGEAGAVGRVPAPEVEALVWQPLAARLGLVGGTPSREALQTYIKTIKIHARSVELVFQPSEGRNGAHPASPELPETLELPWAPKPSVAVKGIAHEGSSPSLGQPKPPEAVLMAIGKARLWLERLSKGASLAEIAKEEGKGERQVRLLMPLAFLPPNSVRSLVERKVAATTVTDLAKNVPLIW
jgi:hypothetical protein